MNKIVLTGNIAREIELRRTQSGTSVISNCIAVSRDRKDKDGNYGTDFINFVAWDKTADYLAQWARKGDRCELSGRLEARQYDDRNGQKVTVYEVIIESITCFAKKEQEEQQTVEGQNLDTLDLPDDDLPF